MASSRVREAITVVVEDRNMIPSDMNTKTKEYAASFLSKASDHECLDAFDSFSDRLDNIIIIPEFIKESYLCDSKKDSPLVCLS